MYGISAYGASKEGFPSSDDFYIRFEYNLNKKSILFGTLHFFGKYYNVSNILAFPLAILHMGDRPFSNSACDDSSEQHSCIPFSNSACRDPFL